MDIDAMLLKIKCSIQKIIKIFVMHRRKQYHLARGKAFEKYENVKLTKQEKQQVKSFYDKYKQDEGFFQQLYKNICGDFDVRYISEDMQACYIDPYYNNWYYAGYLDNKCYYDVFFPNVKQATPLGYRINNCWFDENKKYTSLDELLVKLAIHNRIFVKEAMDSAGGHGVTCISGENKEELIKLFKNIKTDIIIQMPLTQHKELERVNSSSINSIRIVTMIRKEGVKIYSTILRMGINGNVVDNMSSGGICCGIKEDGQLKEIAYDFFGRKFEKIHPTSKCEFSSVIIPNFRSVCEKAKELHLRIPTSRLISWDFSVDENEEPVLIETNLYHTSCEIHQFCNGPLYGEDTNEILKEVFEK